MTLPGTPRLLYKIAAGLILWGAGFLVLRSHDNAVRAKVKAEAAVAHLTRQADSLKSALKESDTRIAHDTVVLDRTITRYKAISDTIVITDTLRVRQALVACDSVVSATGPAIASLTLGIKTRDATILNRDSVIRALNARFPSRLTTAKHVATGVGIGIAIGAVIWAR